jgi:hypothetical protein
MQLLVQMMMIMMQLQLLLLVVVVLQLSKGLRGTRGEVCLVQMLVWLFLTVKNAMNKIVMM